MKNIILCLIALLLPCMAFAQYADHRNRRTDSLERVLATNPPEGADLMKAYYDLMWGYQQIDVEKTMDYARKCIRVAAPFNEWKDVSGAYCVLGLEFNKTSQYDSALVYYEKALEAAVRMKDYPKRFTEKDIDNAISMTYGNIGNLYNFLGKYPEAIEYYSKASKIFEKNDWKRSLCYASNNTGELYLYMENYEQAKIHLLKSDSLAYVINDSLFIASAKYHLSRLYLKTHDYAKSMQNAEIAFGYYFSHPEEGEDKAFTLNLLSEIWLEGYGDDRRAEGYAREALALLDKLGILREKAVSLRVLATIHLKRGEWRLAEQTALEALATDDSSPANTLLLYGILAKTYAWTGDAARSARYFDRHDSLQSTWSSKNYQSSIREMEVKYETEKKETQIATLESEKRMMTRLVIAGAFIALLFAAAMFFRQKNLAMQKNLAHERLQRMEEHQQLALAEAELEGELAERSRIARDLHDGLGGMLAAVKVNMQNGIHEANGATPSCDLALALLDGSMKELRRLAHHLMPETLTGYGLRQALEIFCQSLPAVQFHYYGADTRFDGKLETLLYRSAHELIHNAVKHARATHINVQLVQEPARIALTVHDDGCGFDPSQATDGTGLRNIRHRVAAFNGEFNTVSAPGAGTEISMEFQL